MSLDQFAFIHRAQLSFFNHKLAADHRIVSVDRLTKDNRGNRIVHPGKANVIEIDRKEVRTLAGFQTADIFSSEHRCPAARAEI